MHEKEIVDILKSARGETDAPLHRAQLRRAVLSSGGSAPLHDFLIMISMHKYYVSLGSVAAVVALALVVAMSPLSPKVVSAQEQVNRAFARAVAISPEMRAQLEEKMKADMLKTLEEAKAAPDLKVMTKEEYEKDGQFTIGGGPTFAPTGAVGVGVGSVKAISIRNAEMSGAPEGGATLTMVNTGGEQGFSEAGEASSDVVFTATAAAPAGDNVKMAGSFSTGAFVAGTAGEGSMLTPVKYLSYTDPQGRKTVLGLDENDTPVFKFVTLNSGDMKRLEDGSIRIEGKQIKMIQAQKTEVVGQ